MVQSLDLRRLSQANRSEPNGSLDGDSDAHALNRNVMDTRRYLPFASALKYDAGVVPKVFLNMEMNALGVL